MIKYGRQSISDEDLVSVLDGCDQIPPHRDQVYQNSKLPLVRFVFLSTLLAVRQLQLLCIYLLLALMSGKAI